MMRYRFLVLTLLATVLALTGACSGGDRAFAETWLPHIDTTRPTLAFFYTDN